MNETITAETDTVICCPACLSHYPVHTSMSGSLGRCCYCDAHFVINVTELTMGGTAAIVFDHPVSSRISFLREGCALLARNAAELLRLAGEPVTPEAVAGIAASLPREPGDIKTDFWRRGRLNKTMERAFHRTQGTPERGRYDAVFEYFVRYIPDRTLHSLDMLSCAFLGVLSVEFDTPTPEPPLPVAERKRGPVERWAGRMGW